MVWLDKEGNIDAIYVLQRMPIVRDTPRVMTKCLLPVHPAVIEGLIAALEIARMDLVIFPHVLMAKDSISKNLMRYEHIRAKNFGISNEKRISFF